MCKIFAGGLLTLALSTPALAAPPVVDGNVSDRGITVADANGSEFLAPQSAAPAQRLGFDRATAHHRAGDSTDRRLRACGEKCPAPISGATPIDGLSTPRSNNHNLLVHEDLPSPIPEPSTRAARGIEVIGLSP